MGTSGAEAAFDLAGSSACSDEASTPRIRMEKQRMEKLFLWAMPTVNPKPISYKCISTASSIASLIIRLFPTARRTSFSGSLNNRCSFWRGLSKPYKIAIFENPIGRSNFKDIAEVRQHGQVLGTEITRAAHDQRGGDFRFRQVEYFQPVGQFSQHACRLFLGSEIRSQKSSKISL